jgi:sugar phosphate permease
MLTAAQRARLHRLRWTVFLLVGLAYVLSFFHRMAPAAIAAELQQAFAASGTALGALAATYFYVYMLMQLPTGVLVDTLGVRRVVSAGGLIAGLGSIVFGTAASLAGAAVGRLLVGLGVSVMFVAMLKVNALWFRERHFATVTGLTVLVGNLGAVLAAAPLVWMAGLVSWRSVFVAIGALSIVLAVATWWLVHNAPKDAGLPSMRELDRQAPHAPHLEPWLAGLKAVLTNRATWPGFLPALGAAGTLFSFAGLWAVPYLRDMHALSAAQAATHTALLLAGFAVGAFANGWLSDRIKRRRPVMLANLTMYCLCWLPLLLGRLPAAPLSLALFALMGATVSGFTLVWSVAKEVNRPALSGMATSVVNTGAFLGGALLQPLVGWAMDRSWDGRLVDGVRIYGAASHHTGIAIHLGFALLGLAGALMIRETHARHTGA